MSTGTNLADVSEWRAGHRDRRCTFFICHLRLAHAGHWCFLLLSGKGYIIKPIFRGETVFYLKCDMLYILIRSLVNALYDFIRMDKKEMILATQEFQVSHRPLLLGSRRLSAHCDSSVFTYWTLEKKSFGLFSCCWSAYYRIGFGLSIWVNTSAICITVFTAEEISWTQTFASFSKPKNLLIEEIGW